MAYRKVLIIYHRVDYDGIFSGIITKKFYESKGIRTDTCGWNYGEPIPEIKKDYQGIILVDLSFPPQDMIRLKDSGRLTWIDHHQTSIQDSTSYGYQNLPGIRRIGISAAELVWGFYNSKKEVPLLVQMAGAYDVWDKERFGWSDVVELQYGLKEMYGLSFGKIETDWEDLCDDCEWIQDRGSVVYGWLKKMSESWIKNCSFPVTVAGKYKGIAIVSPLSGSLIFESVLPDYDLFLVIQIRDKGTKYSVSMYSEPEKELGDFSCGEYLKSIDPNAGGHKLAASIQGLSRERFEKLIYDHEF